MKINSGGVRVVLTPTISVTLHNNPATQPRGNFMSDIKLFDADGEVRTGDVVHFNGKPCYVERIRQDHLITIVSMDERKMTMNVQPHQIGCVIGRGE